MCFVALALVIGISYSFTENEFLFGYLFFGSLGVGIFYFYQVFLNTKNAAIIASKQKLIEEITRYAQERERIREQRLQIESRDNDLIQQTDGIGLDKLIKVNDFYKRRRVDDIEMRARGVFEKN